MFTLISSGSDIRLKSSIVRITNQDTSSWMVRLESTSRPTLTPRKWVVSLKPVFMVGVQFKWLLKEECITHSRILLETSTQLTALFHLEEYALICQTQTGTHLAQPLMKPSWWRPTGEPKRCTILFRLSLDGLVMMDRDLRSKSLE